MPEQAPYSSIPVAPNLLHYFVPIPLAAIVNHLSRRRAEPTEDQPMFRIIMDPSNLTTIAAAHEITLALYTRNWP